MQNRRIYYAFDQHVSGILYVDKADDRHKQEPHTGRLGYYPV